MKINISCNCYIAGDYHCPVTYKVFNDHSHIVAIKTSGNVFSYEVRVLCVCSVVVVCVCVCMYVCVCVCVCMYCTL